MALKHLCSLNFVAAMVLLAMFAYQTLARTTPDWLMAYKHDKWMSEFGRIYKDEAEKAARRKIFHENVDYIKSFNKAGANKTYYLATNAFSDLTHEEFLAGHFGYTNGFGSMASSSSFRYANVTEVPDRVDWREKGAVTEVKQQGRCGSCWAFSAVAATEGFQQLATGMLTSLSEQELVDCDTTRNTGCSGGSMEFAFEYIISKQGLTAEINYPYVGADSEGTCKADLPRAAINIKGFEMVPPNSELALMMAVAHQPVSVYINGYVADFQYYAGGVFNGDCGTGQHHSLTVVGYGEDIDGTKFWVCKNSWGTSWGEDGFIRIKKDVEAVEGLCGIAMHPTYPVA